MTALFFRLACVSFEVIVFFLPVPMPCQSRHVRFRIPHHNVLTDAVEFWELVHIWVLIYAAIRPLYSQVFQMPVPCLEKEKIIVSRFFVVSLQIIGIAVSK